MKKSLVSLAIMAALSSNAALSMTVEERLAAMENRINQLEQRVASQDQVIQQKEAQIEQLQQTQQETAEAESGGWFQSVEIGGVVEVNADRINTDGAGTSSDLYVSTAELDISAQVNDWTTADLVLLYEDGDDGINMDTATITIADPNSIWALTAGKTVVPFGVYESYLLSDPLTLELGETAEDTLIFGLEDNGFNGGVYVYKGDVDANDNYEIGSYGGWLGYARETEAMNYSATIGYTNNLGDSDGFEGIVASVADGGTALSNQVDAWQASIGLNVEHFSFMAEYVGALDDFEPGELVTDIDTPTPRNNTTRQSPSAYHIEGAYHFSIAQKESTFAIGYGETDEAEFVGLAEKRFMTALSIGVMDNMAVTFEYANEEDYAGVDTDTVTGQLAVEF